MSLEAIWEPQHAELIYVRIAQLKTNTNQRETLISWLLIFNSIFLF